MEKGTEGKEKKQPCPSTYNTNSHDQKKDQPASKRIEVWGRQPKEVETRSSRHATQTPPIHYV